MKIQYLSLIAATALALTACANSASPRHAGHEHHQHHGKHEHKPVANEAQFSCKNGMTVRVQYADEQVTLSTTTLPTSATLALAPAASGMYYTGTGFYNQKTEWHEKNGKAVFAFADTQGKAVETSCRINNK